MKGIERIVNPETGEETLREIEVIVTEEAPAEPTDSQRIADLEEALDMLLSGVTE